jgi:hypothetical protein
LPNGRVTAIIPFHLAQRGLPMFRDETETLNTLRDKLAELRRYL